MDPLFAPILVIELFIAVDNECMVVIELMGCTVVRPVHVMDNF